MSTTLRYVLCDVFTDRPLTGNPLAVFTDARSLNAETMQAIAREMNLSETVFVLRPQAGGHARLRIFMPRKEIPFAGHPVLGSAFVLGGALQAETIRFETGIGIVPVRLEREAATIAFAWMEQKVPSERAVDNAQELLEALGVAKSELPIVEYDNGARHAYVVVSSFEAVAALKPDFTRLAALGAFGVNVCAQRGASVKTRMFAAAAGVLEDPATGSAAGPLAVHLAKHGRVPFGEILEISQGEELQRPSTLHAVAHGTAERIERVEVGGAGVVVGRGELRI
jgi:trans-2,3-dihydro-3-hydroxyanthranilate isomerase